MCSVPGPLLDNFFTYTAKQIAGLDTPKVIIYSGHDTNVYSLMAVSKIYPRQGVPKYNSAFAIELRQVENTDKYVVLVRVTSQLHFFFINSKV